MNTFLKLIYLLSWVFCSSSTNLIDQDMATSKNILYEFPIMIWQVTRTIPLKYSFYGCWCGPGGGGHPVDELDKCCRAHDWCYDQVEVYGCSPKLSFYKFSAQYGSAVCLDEENTCARRICECDRIMSECMVDHLSSYNVKHFASDRLFKCEKLYKPLAVCEASDKNLSASISRSELDNFFDQIKNSIEI